MLVSASRRNNLFQSSSYTRAGGLGEKPKTGKFANPRTASPARETRALPYVNAMHWNELTTSSGPFSVKKLS